MYLSFTEPHKKNGNQNKNSQGKQTHTVEWTFQQSLNHISEDSRGSPSSSNACLDGAPTKILPVALIASLVLQSGAVLWSATANLAG